MDPQKIAAALMASNPSMSPDLAMRIATNVTQPNGGYGSQPNGYDVIDDKAGQVDGYLQSFMPQGAPPSPQAPSGPGGHDMMGLAQQALQKQQQDGLIARRDELNQERLLQRRDQLEGAKLIQRRDYLEASKHKPGVDVYEVSRTPPTIVGGIEGTQSQRYPNQPANVKAKFDEQARRRGESPALTADTVSSADPRTERDPRLDIRRQRIVKYHELMAKSHSGKAITDEERQWLNQVTEAARERQKQ